MLYHDGLAHRVADFSFILNLVDMVTLPHLMTGDWLRVAVNVIP